MILEYYVMRNEGGVTMWLAESGRAWTEHFHSAAAFQSAKHAHNSARRQLSDDRVFYVMGCMASESDEEDEAA